MNRVPAIWSDGFLIDAANIMRARYTRTLKTNTASAVVYAERAGHCRTHKNALVQLIRAKPFDTCGRNSRRFSPATDRRHRWGVTGARFEKGQAPSEKCNRSRPYFACAADNALRCDEKHFRSPAFFKFKRPAMAAIIIVIRGEGCGAGQGGRHVPGINSTFSLSLFKSESRSCWRVTRIWFAGAPGRVVVSRGGCLCPIRLIDAHWQPDGVFTGCQSIGIVLVRTYIYGQ